MKKFNFPTLFLGAVLLASTGLVGCSNSSDAEAGNATESGADSITTATSPTLNIRFIDGDSVTANYNFAKDLKEAAVRAYSKLEAAHKSRQNELENFGKGIDSKMKTNGYLSEESYKADVMKFQKMQSDAENYLGNLQQKTELELSQQQQQLNDSIQAFIKIYNKEKGYDAILFKAAGVYFNPALDITNEVIKGLNERYNKVAKK